MSLREQRRARTADHPNGSCRRSAADEITKATRTRFGRIDILVDNAGIGPGSRENRDDVDWRAVRASVNDGVNYLLSFNRLQFHIFV